jgi:hypothetical protein
MSLKIVPYEAPQEPAVAAFNERLNAGGVTQRFSESHIPCWLPPAPGRRLFVEFFLAQENDGTVRGCYALKHQEYRIGRLTQSIGYLSLPISEGIVDRRYAAVGAQLLLHAIRRQPLIYGLGIGGENEAIARLLRAAGWRVSTVPFFFRVIRPYRFLRNIRILRRSPLRAALLDALAFSGLGWLGGKAANLVLSRRAPSSANIVADEAEEFSDWADDLWRACAPEYPYCAVRDAATLRILYPKENPRFVRLKIRAAGRIIGWAVLLASDSRNHKQFGGMRLGSIVDAFARPAEAEKTVLAADRALRAKNVDIIVSNQSSQTWCHALRRCGYLSGPSNFLFATSRKLTELLELEHISDDSFYLNRGDGDGPINL